ncbi:MAG: hypothetical protein WD316_08600 [Phycisphaeraceae bacterium]
MGRNPRRSAIPDRPAGKRQTRSKAATKGSRRRGQDREYRELGQELRKGSPEVVSKIVGEVLGMGAEQVRTLLAAATDGKAGSRAARVLEDQLRIAVVGYPARHAADNPSP